MIQRDPSAGGEDQELELDDQTERRNTEAFVDDLGFDDEGDGDELPGQDDEEADVFDPVENPDVVARFVDDSEDELVIERVGASHHGVVLIRSGPEGTHLTERQARRLARLLVNIADRGFIEGDDDTPEPEAP